MARSCHAPVCLRVVGAPTTPRGAPGLSVSASPSHQCFSLAPMLLTSVSSWGWCTRHAPGCTSKRLPLRSPLEWKSISPSPQATPKGSQGKARAKRHTMKAHSTTHRGAPALPESASPSLPCCFSRTHAAHLSVFVWLVNQPCPGVHQKGEAKVVEGGHVRDLVQTCGRRNADQTFSLWACMSLTIAPSGNK